jgi:hypothetical protein
MFDNVSGHWESEVFATKTSENVPTPNSIAQPSLVIDSKDRMWVFAQYFKSKVIEACGQGVWLYEDVSVNPTKKWFVKKQIGRHGWGAGNVDVDPNIPDHGVVVTIDGEYEIVDLKGATVKKGVIGPSLSGEKIRFDIAWNGYENVWHSIMNGSKNGSSSYRNTFLTADKVWASYSAYPSQGNDMNHPGVVGDRIDPKIGYMAAVFDEGGLCYNVWNGSKMLFSTTSLPVASGNAMFIYRNPVALVGAVSGGCWISWADKDSKIYIAYISQQGTLSQKTHIADGQTVGINTDYFGNIDVAYMNGGNVCFRKVEIGY